MRTTTACAASFPAAAAEISIALPDVAEVERNEVVYTCGGQRIPVEYINAGSISLAVLKIDGETVVASNVISGSGPNTPSRSISGGPRATRLGFTI